MDTKKLRQKILDLAIRGKLVPQDPNDEPASVLLERIRAEKERLIKEGKIKRSKKVADDEIEAPFEIPESWEWTKIGELCDVVRGGSPRPAGSKEFYDGPIPFLKVADLTHDEGKYVYVAQNSIKEAGLSRTRMIEADTLLLTNSGATLGVPKISTFPTTINDGIAAFLFLPNDIKLYVYWFLKSKTNSFRCIDQGAAQPNLNTDLIKAEQIPLPPLAEQKRIVNEVEKWFALIDALESNEGDLLKAIDKARSKILDLAIHGKLAPQDSNDEPAIKLLKRIIPKFEPCEKDCDLPNGWTLCKLEDIVDYEQPQAYIVQSTEYMPQYKTPVLTAGKSFIIGYTNEEEGICTNLPVIIFDDFTTDSKYVDFPFKVKSSAMKILHVKDGINIQFVCHYMSITRLIGDTHKRYWISEYSKLPIPIPPYNEQLRIVSKIEELFAVLDSIKESLE